LGVPASNYQFVLRCDIPSLSAPSLPGFFRREFFRHAHLCAAGARIFPHFFLAGLDYLLGQNPKTALAGQLLKSSLYGTVFQ
jgi:hypothetical protein